MTRDDIIRMAKEAGGCFENLPLCDAWLFYEDEHLERFATLVAAEKDKEIERLRKENEFWYSRAVARFAIPTTSS